jgi:pimeloyl-ACP methyl ester carboxylesterase
MPVVDNDGVRIHYEIEGSGPALLLVHGKTSSLASWRDLGYIDALSVEHQLISVDARGHGASDKPHDPAGYTTQAHVSDMLAILDDLSIAQTHFFGYSMGGRIGFRMGMDAPERLRSLIIGGMHPYRRDPAGDAGTLQLLRQGMDAYLASIEADFGMPIPEPFRSVLAANDIDALIAITLADMRDPGIGDGLAGMTVPCLIFAGDRDDNHREARQAAGTLPNATFVSIAGCGHVQDLAQPELVLPHVRSFLRLVESVSNRVDGA